eukprot:2489816-Amphidinium_carterae.1
MNPAHSPWNSSARFQQLKDSTEEYLPMLLQCPLLQHYLSDVVSELGLGSWDWESCLSIWHRIGTSITRAHRLHMGHPAMLRILHYALQEEGILQQAQSSNKEGPERAGGQKTLYLTDGWTGMQAKFLSDVDAKLAEVADMFMQEWLEYKNVLAATMSSYYTLAPVQLLRIMAGSPAQALASPKKHAVVDLDAKRKDKNVSSLEATYVAWAPTLGLGLLHGVVRRARACQESEATSGLCSWRG